MFLHFPPKTTREYILLLTWQRAILHNPFNPGVALSLLDFLKVGSKGSDLFGTFILYYTDLLKGNLSHLSLFTL